MRAEIAGRHILRNSDQHRNCSKKTLAGEYVFCEETIKNLCKEFENEQKIVKAITAAEQYHRRNLSPTQRGASSTPLPVENLVLIPNFHPRQVATAVPPAGRISSNGYTHLYLPLQAEYLVLTPLRPRQVGTGCVSRPGESCSYSDMAPRRRRSAAVGRNCCHGSSASPPPPPSPHSSPTFYSHWLPQAQNSEPKAVEGRGLRARWGETEMSENAGSYNVSGRWRVSVCRPLQALPRKARGAKRWGSAQQLAQSNRRVFLLVQISMGLLIQISFPNGLVLGSHVGDAGNSTSMS